MLRSSLPKSSLPSVLSPEIKSPQLSIPQAIDYLQQQNAPYLASLPLILPITPVDVCIYDPIGKLLKVWNGGELSLSPSTTLRALILHLQELIDRCLTFLCLGGRKYLVADIEIRAAGEGYPKISGVLNYMVDGGALKGVEREQWDEKLVNGMTWVLGDGQGVYWDAYRVYMQIGSLEGAFVRPKPMLKVRTVRMVHVGFDNGEEIYCGHCFVGDAGVRPEKGKAVVVGEGAHEVNSPLLTSENKAEKFLFHQKINNSTTGFDTGSGICTGMAYNTGNSKYGNAMKAVNSRLQSKANDMGINQAEIDLAMKMIESQKLEETHQRLHGTSGNGESSNKDSKPVDVYAIYMNHLQTGGGGLKVDMDKEKGKAKEGKGKGKEKTTESTDSTEPEKNWGYYQRMGGDKRMHALFDLSKSKVPFNVKDSSHYDDDQETVKSLSADAPDPNIKMVPYVPPETIIAALEEAARPKAKPYFNDAARGFCEEDDDEFAPNVDKPRSPIIESKKETKKDVKKDTNEVKKPVNMAALNALRGAAPPQHKKVESLRATGLAKVLGEQATPQASSSQQSSPYLSSLGSSGVAPAPPAGTYSSFGSFAAFAINNGLKPGAPGYQLSPASQSPLRKWSDAKTPSPAVDFYETMDQGGSGQGNMVGSGMGGGSPSLGLSNRTTSRFQFQQQGTVTPLRADSPAFQSNSTQAEPEYPQACGTHLSQQQGGRSVSPAVFGSQLGQQQAGSLGASSIYPQSTQQQAGGPNASSAYGSPFVQQQAGGQGDHSAYGYQFNQQQAGGPSASSSFTSHYGQQYAGDLGATYYGSELDQQQQAMHYAHRKAELMGSSAYGMQGPQQQGSTQDPQQFTSLQVLQQGDGMQSSRPYPPMTGPSGLTSGDKPSERDMSHFLANTRLYSSKKKWTKLE